VDHEQDHDRKFFDTFTLVIGLLIAFVIAMYFLANALAEPNREAFLEHNRIESQLVNQRLAPVGQVNIAGQTPTPAAGQGPQVAKAKPMTGKQVYQNVCSACHGAGVLGAPKFGNKTSWAPHVAKGLATLKKHALHGFKQMPAKGGNPALSDQEVINALEYMVSHSGGKNIIPSHS
jgi:cytochrome c5